MAQKDALDDGRVDDGVVLALSSLSYVAPKHSEQGWTYRSSSDVEGMTEFTIRKC